MELRMVHLQRNFYGENKGHLEGTLEITTVSGDIKIRLDEQKAERILQIVSQQLVESAKEVAENITREIIEHTPALEHKEEDDVS